MTKKDDAPVREGLSLAEPDAEKDPGVYAVYPGLPDSQWVKFRTVLTDGILDQATEAANASGKYSNAKFRASLIKQMVLACNVQNRAKDPATENAYLDVKDDATLARLPTQFLLWLHGEINRCDGSIANVSKMVIAGKEVDFRMAVG